MWRPENPERIKERYIQGESLTAIASELGLSRDPVVVFLRSEGVEIRTRVDAAKAVGTRKRKWQYEPQLN
jgi:biotin operon repressor